MKKYRIFFNGEIDPDFELEKVRLSMQSYLNLTDNKLDCYFSGGEITIKDNLLQADALNLITDLAIIGAICQFEIVPNLVTLSDNTVIIDRRIDNRRDGSVERRTGARAWMTRDRRGADRRVNEYEYA